MRIEKSVSGINTTTTNEASLIMDCANRLSTITRATIANNVMIYHPTKGTIEFPVRICHIEVIRGRDI